MARFAPLGFTLAPDTVALMRTMVDSGELDALVPERVWKEMERALGEPRRLVLVTDTFFEINGVSATIKRMLDEAMRRGADLIGGARDGEGGAAPASSSPSDSLSLKTRPCCGRCSVTPGIAV